MVRLRLVVVRFEGGIIVNLSKGRMCGLYFIGV